MEFKRFAITPMIRPHRRQDSICETARQICLVIR
jgi:hypothetical protein